jgi:AcrR family transcriptional regulator
LGSGSRPTRRRSISIYSRSFDLSAAGKPGWLVRKTAEVVEGCQVAYVKADERRRQLVRSARQVIERDGMAAASLRAVAAQADVPIGTVYYVFPTKEELLKAVLEDVVDQINSAAVEVKGRSKDFRTLVRSMVLGVWTRMVEGDPGEQIMQFELAIWALRTPGMEEVSRWQYELYLDVLTRLWTQASARAGVALGMPADRLARFTLAGFDGLIFQHLTLRDTARSRADASALVDMLLDYAAPRPAASG